MAQRKSTSEETHNEISEKIRSGVITYHTLQDEIDPWSYFNLNSVARIYSISQDPKINPFEEAQKTKDLFENSEVVIFIPGTAFDIHGTRHGRGIGWYDRFLSSVPRKWIKVGICYDDQFSTIPLVRESWDEAMDFMCVVNKVSGELICVNANV